MRNKQRLLDKANLEIDDLGGKLKKTKSQYLKINRKLQALQKLNEQFKRLNEDMAKEDATDEIEVLPYVNDDLDNLTLNEESE